MKHPGQINIQRVLKAAATRVDLQVPNPDDERGWWMRILYRKKRLSPKRINLYTTLQVDVVHRLIVSLPLARKLCIWTRPCHHCLVVYNLDSDCSTYANKGQGEQAVVSQQDSFRMVARKCRRGDRDKEEDGTTNNTRQWLSWLPLNWQMDMVLSVSLILMKQWTFWFKCGCRSTDNFTVCEWTSLWAHPTQLARPVLSQQSPTSKYVVLFPLLILTTLSYHASMAISCLLQAITFLSNLHNNLKSNYYINHVNSFVFHSLLCGISASCWYCYLLIDKIDFQDIPFIRRPRAHKECKSITTTNRQHVRFYS